MPTNPYFDHYHNTPEQNLMADLIIETIKFYGKDLYYIPRTESADWDQVYGEDPRKSFDNAYILEMYIKNTESFGGAGDLVSQFGLEIRDQTTFQISMRRFEELIGENPGLTAQGITRPREGDLIYFDFVRPDPKFPGAKGQFFEILFVEAEAIHYQLGALHTYDLQCETFVYSSETFDTGILEIDSAFANGFSSYVLTGNTMPSSNTADNQKIEDEAAGYLDLSDTSPFGDYS